MLLAFSSVLPGYMQRLYVIKYKAEGRLYPSPSTGFLPVSLSKEPNLSCPQPLEPSQREGGWGGVTGQGDLGREAEVPRSRTDRPELWVGYCSQAARGQCEGGARGGAQGGSSPGSQYAAVVPAGKL